MEVMIVGEGMEVGVVGGLVGRTAIVTIAQPTKRLPQVGDSLLILHEVKRSPDGEVLGLKRSGRNDTTEITAVYLDGTVRSGTGDAWEVAFNGFSKGGKPQWKTVNPWLEEKNRRVQEFAELNKVASQQ